MSVFIPIFWHFNDCCFVIYFKSGSEMFLALFSVLKMALAVALFHGPTKMYLVFFPSSVKNIVILIWIEFNL